MDDLVSEVADGPAPEPKRNRGWFQPGDPRINLEGRPRGTKVTVPNCGHTDCARRADRIKGLFVDEKYLAHRLTNYLAPWFINLPNDSQIVDCRYDGSRQGIVLIVRSKEFPRIAKGAVIPEIPPHFHGLKWRGSEWPSWH